MVEDEHVIERAKPRSETTTVAATIAAGSTDEPRDANHLGRGSSVGRYLILSQLGEGGMGVVYAAFDGELDRRVALKLLRTAGGSEGARHQLAREARALGKLSHPNVVQVHDVGEHDGDVFVAMELVEGRSLDQWSRREPRPGWREILAAYLDAARGLAAAHDKGLVHRDVKPSNMLRGDDGRVRVADFGLAGAHATEQYEPRGGPLPIDAKASLDETIPARSGGDDERLTAVGALAGTPLYMAPEQHRGATSAASDQYSLCVALHEGLYGAAPFALDPDDAPAAMMARLLQQKQAGPPATPPPGGVVPAWVYRALSRGLSPSPGDRYPSMEALIAALSDDPDARRQARTRRGVIAGAVALLLVVAAAGWARSGALRDPCAHPEQHLAGVWDAPVKARVQVAFAGTRRPYADATWSRVAALLDGYAGAHAAMRGEVCHAARDGRQTPAITGARDACLERRRGQLQALITLLADKPDPDVLDRAVQAASGLPPIASCADTEALLAPVRPPEDPVVKALVAALEPRVDRIEALFEAGKYREGVAIGEPILAEAERVPYAPLRARAALTVARLRLGAGDADGAKALLLDAAVSAAEGRDDVLGAHAWSWLLFVVGERQRRAEEAATIRMLGATALARTSDLRAQALWSNVEGSVLALAGKPAESRAAHERAIALREVALGPDHPETATSLRNLASALCMMDACREARALLERAVAISERAQGPDHPDTAISLGNLGNTLRRTGSYAEARAAHERALGIKERALGPDHRSVAATLNNLGNTLRDLGDLGGASSALERSLAIKERAVGPDHPDLAGTTASLGLVRVRQGRLDEARALAERAQGLRDKGDGPDHPGSAEPLWLFAEIALARHEPEPALRLLERAAKLRNAELVPVLDLAMAEALWQLGKDRPRARALAERARDHHQRGGHAPGLAQATEWLSRHPAG